MQKDHSADLVLLQCGREQRSRMNHKIERREEVQAWTLLPFIPKVLKFTQTSFKRLCSSTPSLTHRFSMGYLSSQLIYPQLQVSIWKTRTARTLFFRYTLRIKHRDHFELLEYYVYMNWPAYLYNKMEAFLSEHHVIMMPQFFWGIVCMKTTMFRFSLEQEWQSNLKPPSLAERSAFKTTRRYWRWLWMSYLKHQKLQITITWHGFAGSPCSSYPFQILPIFSCMMLLVWCECTPQTVSISQWTWCRVFLLSGF